MNLRNSYDATGPKHLDVTLSRAKFNELTADLVERTMKPVRQAMADAGLSASDLDKVIFLILASRAARHLPAHLPDTRQLSRATRARSSA